MTSSQLTTSFKILKIINEEIYSLIDNLLYCYKNTAN